MVSLSSLFLQETMCSFFLPEAIIRRPVNCTTESHRPQMKCTLRLVCLPAYSGGLQAAGGDGGRISAGVPASGGGAGTQPANVLRK